MHKIAWKNNQIYKEVRIDYLILFFKRIHSSYPYKKHTGH